MQIPAWPMAGDREADLLREVLASPQWGGFSPFVGKFEEAFAAFQQTRHCVSAANGTVTLEVGLAASGIGPGDEVIVPAISFVSTATAVNRVGATPVFVDIEPHTFNIDPIRAADAVTERTKAIVAVHFGGPLANMDALESLCAAAGLMLVEDAAHAHGSEWRGRRAGSIGRWSSFSFQNGKVLTAGEGGALLTNDDALAAEFRSLANQGRRADGQTHFHHYRLASNHRITGLQAAILLAQLERLPEQIALRERNVKLLHALTANVPGLHWQTIVPEVTASSHYLLLGRIDAGAYGETRNQLCARLAAAGVPHTPFYPHPLYANPMYREGGCASAVLPCPVTEACIEDAFWLPHRVLHADEATLREIAAVFSRAGAGSAPPQPA